MCDVLYLIAEHILDSLVEILEFLSPVLTSLLLIHCLIELKALLAHANELATKLLEPSDGTFINRINEQQALEALLENLEEGRIMDRSPVR